MMAPTEGFIAAIAIKKESQISEIEANFKIHFLELQKNTPLKRGVFFCTMVEFEKLKIKVCFRHGHFALWLKPRWELAHLGRSVLNYCNYHSIV